ncbi:uncharacterized protein DS421_19g666000 [Arachis hypogaea]|uniref:Uncharacterized protein n=1 Tax=Arachis hypogaea TaxID=3818 RepID=A0A6B9VDD3_ARAHY|nr:uncharacterized protein DS421_19g666000 [Arachis hypogaea]
MIKIRHNIISSNNHHLSIWAITSIMTHTITLEVFNISVPRGSRRRVRITFLLFSIK